MTLKNMPLIFLLAATQAVDAAAPSYRVVLSQTTLGESNQCTPIRLELRRPDLYALKKLAAGQLETSIRPDAGVSFYSGGSCTGNPISKVVFNKNENVKLLNYRSISSSRVVKVTLSAPGVLTRVEALRIKWPANPVENVVVTPPVQDGTPQVPGWPDARLTMVQNFVAESLYCTEVAVSPEAGRPDRFTCPTVFQFAVSSLSLADSLGPGQTKGHYFDSSCTQVANKLEGYQLQLNLAAGASVKTLRLYFKLPYGKYRIDSNIKQSDGAKVAIRELTVLNNANPNADYDFRAAKDRMRHLFQANQIRIAAPLFLNPSALTYAL